MEHFFPIMVAHLTTTALGGFYVYKRGATPVRVVALGTWAILFFPVAYNVVKFM
ncbi:MAG: hypothetical protein OQK24_02245 [Magnetovibrio sp.]|nr:hypothetical protein [Magnetovibrio sp.]